MSSHCIEDVLFPVNLKPVYIQQDTNSYQGSGYSKVPGFEAVIAQDNGRVFSVVAKNYRLITNQEALKLGEVCFEKVFKILKPNDMEIFNIIMPKTRSFMHVDFIHPEKRFDLFKDDQWFPYLRVTNSYNRMFAMNFELGFCRGICTNGIIFGGKNIEFKFVHTKTAKDPVVKFTLKAGELAALEIEFIESLKNLKRFHVPPGLMWPLACKVFSINVPDIPSPQQAKTLVNKKNHILELTQKYFEELGQNGYAALNVLTDYASRPVGVVSPEGNINALQRKAGSWVSDFIEAISSRSFNFDNYLGEYVKEAM